VSTGKPLKIGSSHNTARQQGRVEGGKPLKGKKEGRVGGGPKKERKVCRLILFQDAGGPRTNIEKGGRRGVPTVQRGKWITGASRLAGQGGNQMAGKRRPGLDGTYQPKMIVSPAAT